MMKSTLALAIALTLGTSGVATAGMQGQGPKPDAQKPEYEEKKPGGYRLYNIDKDVDRHISKEEAKVNRHLTEQFDKLDKNNDNKLDKSELASFQTGGSSP
jgi:hypothetical protein